MDRTEKARQKYEELFHQEMPGDEADPELMGILQRLIFGDIFHTGNLDDRTRKLITISGNLKAGNSKETLPAAMVHFYPCIGFLRVSNAIQIIKEASIE